MNLTYIRVHGKCRFALPQSISGRKPISPTQSSSALRLSSFLTIALAGLLVMTACGRATHTSQDRFQPITNGTISRELGPLPAAATAFLWAMVVEHPLRNSKAH